MYQIGQTEQINIYRHEANFDRACDEARQAAFGAFGCDDSGNLSQVEGFDRTTDTVRVTFAEYSAVSARVGGTSHRYLFEASVERDEHQTSQESHKTE